MDLLAEIRAAFPSTAYPGDAMLLGDCCCDECQWSVRDLRGRSWMSLRDGDSVGGEGASLSVKALRYDLPGLLCLAIQRPDEGEMYACEVNSRLVMIGGADAAKAEAVRETMRRLALRQRAVVARFLSGSPINAGKRRCSLRPRSVQYAMAWSRRSTRTS